MKRFLPREFWLMCAPIALFGTGIWLFNTLKSAPAPDSKAKISLSVRPNLNVTAPNNQVSFGWTATASGGPANDRRIGYSQTLTASGHGKTKVIYNELQPSRFTNGSNSTSISGGPHQKVVTRDMSLSNNALPLWTEKLTWRGEIVAVPEDQSTPGTPVSALPPATLQQWAQIPGAARYVAVRLFSLGNAGLIQELALDKVNPSNVKLGADTCITAKFRNYDRHVFARLVAFDGRKYRTLWSNNDYSRNDYHVATQGSGGTDDYELFKLRDVPANWGEIIYILDAVADPDFDEENKIGGTISCGASEIARRKKAGWLPFSRRLVVRKKDETVKQPVYSATPNTQFRRIEYSLTPKEWTITVRLNYRGTDKTYDLDSPNGPEFYEANGKLSTLQSKSYGIRDGATPNERLLVVTIPRENMGQPRTLKMKVEIADSQAAPLVISLPIQVPKTKP